MIVTGSRKYFKNIRWILNRKYFFPVVTDIVASFVMIVNNIVAIYEDIVVEVVLNIVDVILVKNIRVIVFLKDIAVVPLEE